MPASPSQPEPRTARKGFPPWDRADLASPPAFHVQGLKMLIGPGLLMVGSNIGGGEWLFGPLVTAQYGGQIMWLATVSILVQAVYNLSVMRYTLYTGEPVFVGFFRTPPGPKFWIFFYMLGDFGGIWPYLASNAAVPLAAAFLGRLPSAADDTLVRTLGYCIFVTLFVPLIFGGKIYNAVEKLMLAKLVTVLSYLGFVALFFVSWSTWGDIFSGFLKFGSLPEGDFNWATLAAFAAVAGAGGMNNMNFSNYARDKGWGMGQKVGAIPSAVGGRKISLSHTGKVFELTPENLARWKGWLNHIRRDQLMLWVPGCILGMALPAMFSYEFIRGVDDVSGHAVAAMSAEGIAARHGQIFWFLSLFCGFIIMAPTQVPQVDGFCRRWTDVMWVGIKRFHTLEGHKVKNVYYTMLTLYAIWGLLALRLTPDPLVLAVASGVMMNFVLGISALHTLYVNLTLLPRELRPGWILRLGLVACSIFYCGISILALNQQMPRIVEWLGR